MAVRRVVTRAGVGLVGAFTALLGYVTFAPPVPHPTASSSPSDVASSHTTPDTGDVILFDRDCSTFRPYAATLCRGAKSNLFGGKATAIDHVGVVLKRQDGEVYVVEADFKGVTVRLLQDRMSKTRRTRLMAWRPLDVDRTPEMRARVDAFVEDIKHHPYNDNVLHFARAYLSSGVKSSVIDVYQQLRAAEEEEAALSAVIDATATATTAATTPTTTAEPPSQLVAKRGAARQRVLELKAQVHHIETSWAQGGVTMNPPDASSFFCSQLVAELYQQLGLLPTAPAASHYLPVDFTDDRALPLQRGAKLLPAVRIK